MEIGKKQTKGQKGFTIVELLIATTVFSTVLLVVTTGIIRIGQIYYKNLTQNRTQEAARTVSSDITSAIQLASGQILVVNYDPGNNKGIYCVGNTRYTYQLNRVYDASAGLTTSNFGLVAENKPPSDPCNQEFDPDTAKAMLGNNMRLLDFSICGEPSCGNSDLTGKTWQVKIKVAYGINDLLTHYSEDGTAPQGWGGANNSEAGVKDATCRTGILGSSFCATSQLDTLVKRRLNVE